MKIFLDSNCDYDLRCSVKNVIHAAGHQLSGEWLLQKVGQTKGETMEWTAIGTLEGIRECDMVIVLGNSKSAWGSVAAGLALNKQTVVVTTGAVDCIFQCHPKLKTFASLGDMYALLRGRYQ